MQYTDRNLSLEFYIIKNLTYLRCYNINYTNVYWNLYHVCEYIFDYNFSFQDHRAAFKSKTTWEVLRAMLVYQLCGINMLVDNNEKVKMVVLKIKKKLTMDFQYYFKCRFCIEMVYSYDFLFWINYRVTHKG